MCVPMHTPDHLEIARAARSLTRERIDLVAGLGPIAVGSRARIIVAFVYLSVGVAETDGNVTLQLILESHSLRFRTTNKYPVIYIRSIAHMRVFSNGAWLQQYLDTRNGLDKR